MFPLDNLQQVFSGVLQSAGEKGFSDRHAIQTVQLSGLYLDKYGGLGGILANCLPRTICAIEGKGTVLPVKAAVTKMVVDLAINPTDGKLLGGMTGTPEAITFYDQVMRVINPLVVKRRG